MNQKQFNELLDEMRKREDELLRSKGKEYAQDGDRLMNFRQRALFEGRSMSEVALGDMMKHVQSITKAVRSEEFINNWNYVREDGGEGLKQRFIDARNYLALLAGCIEVDQQILNEEE